VVGLGRYAVGLGIGVVVGCGAFPTFLCESDAQCLSDGVEGLCEIDGACSFPDYDCPSGRRYGALGGFAGAGQCVGEDEVASGGAGGSSSDTTSPGASSTSGTSDGSGGGAEPSTTTDGGTTDAGTSGPVSGGGGPTGGGGGSTGVEGGSTGATVTETTVTFGEGPGTDFGGVTRDTFISNQAQDINAGGHGDLHIVGGGSGTALVRFRLSDAIPQGADIQSAELYLHTGDSAAMNCMIGVYEVYEFWWEGSQDEAPGYSNWNLRDDQIPWTTPGAGSGSRSDNSMATIAGAGTDQAVTIDIPPDVVQGWVDDPGSNNGVALVTWNTCFGWFMSSEASSGSQRPRLTVTYK
jgi:hypothetical protein